MSFRITLKDERAFITELMNLKTTGDNGSGLRRFVGQQRAYLPSLFGKLAGVVAANPDLVPVPRTIQEMSDLDFGRRKLNLMAVMLSDPKCRLISARIDLDNLNFLSSRIGAYLSFLRERFRRIAEISDPTERRLALFAIAARYQYDGPEDLVHKFDRGNFTFPAWPPVPATDPFLRWIIAADTFVHLLKRCAAARKPGATASNSDCHTPYFVAGRETQLYCSESCAAPSVKKSKCEWARKHRGG